jgi:hypothetical protein
VGKTPAPERSRSPLRETRRDSVGDMVVGRIHSVGVGGLVAVPLVTLGYELQGRAAPSAAPGANSCACHGLGVVALAEGHSTVAQSAIRIRLSVAPSCPG